MNAELRELYQNVILDHHKRPRNFKQLEHANRFAEGYNPLCGDRFSVFVEMDGDRIKDVAFTGSGCAISTASASLMTEALKGKTRAEAEEIFQRFHHVLREETSPEDEAALGKLKVFSGVREFPIRVKCATLSWHAFRAAIAGDSKSVTTE